MSVQSQHLNCGDCGEVLQDLPSIDPPALPSCPKCGSIKRTFSIALANTLHVRGMLRLKGRRPGQKKPFIEQKVGDDLHRKTGIWNKLRRVIDRDNDSYSEEIMDPKTGQIIHKQEEPLSQHRGHGGAKKKKNPDSV